MSSVGKLRTVAVCNEPCSGFDCGLTLLGKYADKLISISQQAIIEPCT